MAWVSIGLGVLSLVCVGLGVLFTPLPVVGAVFAFGAPMLATAGIVTGGIALSRARSARASASGAPYSGAAPLTGVIISSVALLPALLTALTCGVCNALFSTAHIQSRGGTWSLPPDVAGAFGSQRPRPADSDEEESDAGAGDDAPPPAFPAPPMPSSHQSAPHAPHRHRR